jgi:hypothetical protein
MPNYEVRQFDKGAVIFNEGDMGDAAYLLQEGQVQVSKQVSGRDKVLAELSPVSVFGEMAVLLPDRKRTATARALDRVKVVVINKKNFDAFIDKTPNIIQSILGVLVQRLKESTDKHIHSSGIFHGLVLTIDLMIQHETLDIDYLKLNTMLSEFFMLKPEQSKVYIDKLGKLGLVKLWRNQSGVKKVRVYEQESFAARALQALNDSGELNANPPAPEG